MEIKICHEGGDRLLINNGAKPDVLLIPNPAADNVNITAIMIEKGNYLFTAPTVFDEQAIAKKWKDGCKEFFESLKETLSSLDEFTASNIEPTFKECAAKNNQKPGDVLFLFRILLSGQGGGVDLMGMAELLGKEEVIARITKGLLVIAK